MKEVSILVFLIFIAFCTPIVAQEQNIRYYFYGKIGVFQDLHKIKFDEGNRLVTTMENWDGFPGDLLYTIGGEARYKKYAFKLNIAFHEYYSFVGRELIYVNAPRWEADTDHQYDALDISFLGGYRFQFFNKRLNLSLLGGLGFGKLFFYGVDNVEIKINNSTTKKKGVPIHIWQSVTTRTFFNKYNLYLPTNFDLGFRVNPYLEIFVSADYVIGLVKSFKVDIAYFYDDLTQEYNAQTTSNGSYWSANAGIKIPLNWIWE